MMTWFGIWVLCLFAGDGADQLCARCKTTGRVAAKGADDLRQKEGVVRRCSEVISDEDHHYGIGFYPCPKCKAPSLAEMVSKEYETAKAERLEWLHQVQEVDRFFNDPRRLKIMHAKTDHFDIAWAIPKMKVGRRTLNQHELLHLYAERMETLYAEYLDLFQLTHAGAQNSERYRLLAFAQAKHSARAQPKYTGIGGGLNANGAKHLATKSTLVCWWDKTRNRSDEDFHEFIEHNVVHLFLCASFNRKWLAKKHGWVDIGLSHYFTQRHFNQSRTHCFQEQNEINSWIYGSWFPVVRKRAAARQEPIFAELAPKSFETVTVEEHPFCWSYVHYLLEHYEPTQFVEFIKMLKDDLPLRDALRRVYGCSPLQFPELWRQFVLDEYPAR